MEPRPELKNGGPRAKGEDMPWFQRLSSPVLFLTIILALIGGYLAFSIPISVFSEHGFSAHRDRCGQWRDADSIRCW